MLHLHPSGRFQTGVILYDSISGMPDSRGDILLNILPDSQTLYSIDIGLCHAIMIAM